MSYMQFQQRCKDCDEHWNAAFGIVGTTIIAQPPAECPKCGSTKLTRMADGWIWDPTPEMIEFLDDTRGIILSDQLMAFRQKFNLDDRTAQDLYNSWLGNIPQ